MPLTVCHEIIEKDIRFNHSMITYDFQDQNQNFSVTKTRYIELQMHARETFTLDISYVSTFTERNKHLRVVKQL